MSNPPIPHSRPCLGEAEAEAAAAVVKSGWLKGGPRRDELEQTLAADQGFARVLAVTSCTQAIHLALRARFPMGKARVALPSYLCRSAHDAVALAGCQPVLVDSDTNRFGPDPDEVAELEPDAVIVAHLAGVRAPVEEYSHPGRLVIEDCAQRIAPGERPAAASPDHVRVWSFEATKVITGGEGGALGLNDDRLAERALHLRDGGYESREAAAWLPLTDLQAAVILAQWGRLPGLIAERAARIRRLLEAAPGFAALRAGTETAPFRCLLQVRSADAWLREGEARGVSVRRPVGPVPLHRLFQEKRQFTGADALADHLVSVPCQPSLTAEELDRVEACLRGIVALSATHPELRPS